MVEVDVDSLLVGLIEQFGLIYDKNDPMHKDKTAIKNAWKTISYTLKIPVEHCQRRWGVIRNRYSKERRDLAAAPSSATANRKEWHLYPALKFLKQHIKPRRSFGTGSYDTQPSFEQEDDEIFQFEMENADTGPSSKKMRFIEEGNSRTHSEEDFRSPRATPSGSGASSLKGTLEHNLNSAICAFQHFVTNKNIRKTEDSDLNFCLSLYESFKSISKEQKTRAKIELLQVLSKFEEQQETNNKDFM